MGALDEARTILNDAAVLVGSAVRSPRRFARRLRTAADLERSEGTPATRWAGPVEVPEDLPGLAWRTTSLEPAEPALDVLIPGLQARHLSGGPNTALNLTYRLAGRGVPVRFVSTDLPHDDPDALLAHCRRLTGLADATVRADFRSLHDRSAKSVLGGDDLMVATAWWTAQYAMRLCRTARDPSFVYLIQDFEPGFYQWSTQYALALESYSARIVPVVCGNLLADYLREARIGVFGDSETATACLVFEPAIDRSRFNPSQVGRGPSRRRLLFYARPEAPRNLFDLGLLGLRDAVRRGAFPASEWELWFIGGEVPARDLGRGLVIRQHPWLDYDGYAGLLRSCDVGLSLMLSPHTSYPPLEMAACGASVVTNTFANKTADVLSAYAGNLLPVAPTVSGITEGLLAAAERASDIDARRSGSEVRVPGTWEEAFAPVLPSLERVWRDHEALVRARTAT